jgi:transposase
MTAPALTFWTNLLQLPGYEVVFCCEEPELRRYRMTVACQQPMGVCPGCGRLSDTIHQTRTRQPIKDLPLGPYAVELSVRVAQFECAGCGQCFTPAVPFLAEGAHATERFLEQAAELVRHSDLVNAAAFLGVPERTLGDWYYAYLQQRPRPEDQPQKAVRRIGIDELSLKKSTASTSP